MKKISTFQALKEEQDDILLEFEYFVQYHWTATCTTTKNIFNEFPQAIEQCGPLNTCNSVC